ncbi:MAG: hypothetical protein CMH48_02575 [Muricauda sp.]|uniref:Uncharacterized protein n=1 Tax=Flagellimonas lutaonensis TaxID=516051 RepID=A0A0D5YUL1_9FLAO|nr:MULTISPECIES: hypothetical protein [Allomuricauda]AKA35940.1 hypothetical protein VC82_2351 [Allomuricauda lutaonensis]MAU26535.1 hypothetical protein [Allomuricauda sp.]MBC29705.1 hypothetical protein [Allomuricauda sp.]|tara:strand:+ start:87 stop:524 length:438 start_codon:yes stop_codon:yes gene_type:complete
MKTRKISYFEWISAEEMHEQSKDWFMQLNFIRDEQRFFQDLIKNHTLDILDEKLFDESKKVVALLSEMEKSLIPLFKEVQKHKNQLEIMVDDVDQPEMEKAYQKSHQNISKKMGSYVVRYRSLKEKIFSLLKTVLKKRKRRRLLN